MNKLIEEFKSEKIGPRDFLLKLDEFPDSIEKLNFMLSEAIITPDFYYYRKLVMEHPEYLTAHERQPKYSFLLKDINKCLYSMQSKLRVHSKFEYPLFVNYRLPKNYQEIFVECKIQSSDFIYKDIVQFCKFLIENYEYRYCATDLYFGNDFWINEDNRNCMVIRDTDHTTGIFKREIY